MKKRICRWICLSLVLALSAVALLACNGDGGNPDETVVTGGGLVTGTDSPNGDDPDAGSIYETGDRLPDDLYFGNETFNILSWNNTYTREWVESVSVESDFVDTTIYNRMQNVQERIGVTFKFRFETGHYYAMNEFIDTVYNTTALGGNETYDLVAQYSLASSIGTMRGLYQDLRDTSKVPYIDYEAPWYSDELVAANIINDKLYYITGDITPSMIYTMFALIFNKGLMTDYNIPLPYDLVDSGDWTYEAFYEIIRNLYEDTDQSDTETAGDFYGFVIPEANSIDPFQYAFDLYAVTIDPQTGAWGMNADFMGTQGINVVQRLQSLIHDNQSVYLGAGTDEDYNIFTTERGMFTSIVISTLEKKYAGTALNYGILPMPKYDEEQQDYHSCLGMTYTMFSITSNAKDPVMTSAIIEALSSEGYHKMVPAIFEQVFQLTYSKTEDDARMFDVVRDSIVYDPGRTFGELDVFAMVRIASRDNSPWVSYLEGQEERISGLLDEINNLGLTMGTEQ